MTPARFNTCLASLHWGVNTLATILGEHRTTVRRWAEGVTMIPERVAMWLEYLAATHERNPPPTRQSDAGNNTRQRQ